MKFQDNFWKRIGQKSKKDLENTSKQTALDRQWEGWNKIKNDQWKTVCEHWKGKCRHLLESDQEYIPTY